MHGHLPWRVRQAADEPLSMPVVDAPPGCMLAGEVLDIPTEAPAEVMDAAGTKTALPEQAARVCDAREQLRESLYNRIMRVCDRFCATQCPVREVTDKILKCEDTDEVMDLLNSSDDAVYDLIILARQCLPDSLEMAKMRQADQQMELALAQQAARKEASATELRPPGSHASVPSADMSPLPLEALNTTSGRPSDELKQPTSPLVSQNRPEAPAETIKAVKVTATACGIHHRASCASSCLLASLPVLAHGCFQPAPAAAYALRATRSPSVSHRASAAQQPQCPPACACRGSIPPCCVAARLNCA